MTPMAPHGLCDRPPACRCSTSAWPPRCSWSASRAWSTATGMPGRGPSRTRSSWVLLAAVISSFLIGYLLIQAWADPATLGRDNAAWPLFGVSILFTMAHAFSITRYKLMQVEEITNRSVVYFLFSLVGGTDLFGDAAGRRQADRRPPAGAGIRRRLGAVVAALSVVVVLTLFEVARGRFQRVIDRRFFREKYKFDEAMNKMRMAVGSLVDRATLGHRLLEAASEVLRLEWGALYLLDASGHGFQLTASHGPTPDDKVLAADHPLVVAAAGSSDGPALARDGDGRRGGRRQRRADRAGGRGRRRPGERRRARRAAGAGAQAERHALRGRGDGLPGGAGLGRRRWSCTPPTSRRPSRASTRSSRDKVDKIAEQQRRILILQEQLRDRAGSRGRRPGRRSGGPGPPGESTDVGGLRGDQGFRPGACGG